MSPSLSYAKTSAMVTVPVLAVAISIYMFVLKSQNKSPPSSFHPLSASYSKGVKAQKTISETGTDEDSDNDSVTCREQTNPSNPDETFDELNPESLDPEPAIDEPAIDEDGYRADVDENGSEDQSKAHQILSDDEIPPLIEMSHSDHSHSYDNSYIDEHEHSFDDIYGHTLHDDIHAAALPEDNQEHILSASTSSSNFHNFALFPTNLHYDASDEQEHELEGMDRLTAILEYLEDMNVTNVMKGIDGLVSVLNDINSEHHVNEDGTIEPYGDIDYLLQHDILHKLVPLFDHENIVVVKGCLRVISEWLNSDLSTEYINKVILYDSPDIMQCVLDVIDYNINPSVKRDALWIIAKVIGFENHEYTENIINLGLINILTMYLVELTNGTASQSDKSSKDSPSTPNKSKVTSMTTIAVILTCLEGILHNDNSGRFSAVMKDNSIEVILENLLASPHLPWIQSDEDIMDTVHRIQNYLHVSCF